MNREDRVEIVLAHIENHAVAQNTGVVDHDIQLAEIVDRTLDDALGGLEIAHALIVGDRLAAGRANFLDYLFGRRSRLSSAVEVTSKVVDDHSRAELG